MIRVYIGYDDRERVAMYVLAHSILRRASVPVQIVPVVRRTLATMGYQRPRDEKSSTDFSDTRFLVPWLAGYRGLAVFMDCDQLMLGDIAELYALRDSSKAVMVRKHEHIPSESSKFLGATQFQYPRKNWSSLMLFDCEKCWTLTPYYVARAPMLDLHQFKWVADDHIGALPADWNHLVDYEAPRSDVKHVHYTLGGPYFKEYVACGYADAWMEEYRDMVGVQQRDGSWAPVCV